MVYLFTYCSNNGHTVYKGNEGNNTDTHTFIYWYVCVFVGVSVYARVCVCVCVYTSESECLASKLTRELTLYHKEIQPKQRQLRNTDFQYTYTNQYSFTNQYSNTSILIPLVLTVKYSKQMCANTEDSNLWRLTSRPADRGNRDALKKPFITTWQHQSFIITNNGTPSPITNRLQVKSRYLTMAEAWHSNKIYVYVWKLQAEAINCLRNTTVKWAELLVGLWGE